MSSAIVIGAGPAGSLAAMLLAREGWSVTIVEQHTFPRDKVCGECISALGLEVLGRAGLLAKVMQAGAARMSSVILHAPGGRSVEIPLPGEMAGLSRRRFDQILLDLAAEAGAVVRQPARCETIDGGNVRVRGLRTNIIERLSADWIIIADGKSALGTPRPKTTGAFGVKAHFRGVGGERRSIELFGVDGSYGGVAPIEDGLWNVAFSVPGRRLKSDGDIDRLMDAILSENATLSHRMKGARRVGRWLCAPLPRFGVRQSWPDGAIRVGNAAASIEPIGGEGMGLALRSAEIAVEVLSAPCPDVGEIQTRYAALWRRRRLGCRLGAVFVSTPSLCTLSVVALNALEQLRPPVLWWMGKAGGNLLPGTKSLS